MTQSTAMTVPNNFSKSMSPHLWSESSVEVIVLVQENKLIQSQYLIFLFITITMTRQSKSTTTNRTKKQAEKTNIGRPQDDQLETFFMKKLRSGKLQAISAQSEAEIICYNFKDAQSAQSEEKEEEEYIREKVERLVSWFTNIDNNRFLPLWQSFKQGSEKWEFKQITSIQDFPEFLFCDECDLCYVLNYALSQKESLKSKTEFANDELLFLQLLCFASRDQISYRVLKSIQRNLQAVLDMMKNVKSKVISLSKQQQEAEEIKEGDKNGNNGEISCELRKGEIKDMLNKVQIPEKMIEKEKKIEKIPKQGKKVGRPKKKVNQVKEEQLLGQDKLNQVMQKLIAHIQKAYAYIYPVEARKKKLLSMFKKPQQPQQQSQAMTPE